ncbi:MAG: protein tyrosine phosphatase [Gammaproteobacteria bacterium]|nr:protein tyrosine phosphatase [Gammaproteobacteria bacterium]
MTPDIYRIRDLEPLRLAIMPRPRGAEWLEDEVAGWANAGIRIVACLLHRYEIQELGISDEERYCTRFGIEYRSHPIADRGVPERVTEFLEFTDTLASDVGRGSSVAIHCRAGIGRSSLTAGAVLLRLGVAAPEIVPMISRARGLGVPDTPQQAEWFAALCKSFSMT